MNDKQKQILDVAIRLFADEGIGVATARIAKEANISNGTLFNYFATKKELIDKTYIYLKARMAEAAFAEIELTEDTKALIWQAWKSYFNVSQKNPLEYKAVTMLKNSQILEAETVNEGMNPWAPLFEVLEKATMDKILIQAPPLLLCTIADGQLNAIITYAQIHQLSGQERDDLVALGFEIFWKGIRV